MLASKARPLPVGRQAGGSVRSSGLGGGQSTLTEKAVRNRTQPDPAGLRVEVGDTATLTPSEGPSSLESRCLFMFCASEQASPDGPALGNAPVLTAGSWPSGPSHHLKLQTSQRMASLFCILSLLWKRARVSREINNEIPHTSTASDHTPISSSLSLQLVSLTLYPGSEQKALHWLRAYPGCPP